MSTRLVQAVVLTTVALAIPCGAWWLAGTHDVERESRALLDAPEAEAREAAQRLAAGLGDRLEQLRAAEEKRPFYHYQSLYHDPRGGAEGEAVALSPLADGPTDPLVRVYFQVAANGTLTLPTVNPNVPELNNDQARVAQSLALLHELEPIATSCMPAAPTGKVQRQTLDEDAWRQNYEANEVYNRNRLDNPREGQQQRDGQQMGQMGQSGNPSGRSRRGGENKAVEVSLGALEWRTVDLEPLPKGKSAPRASERSRLALVAVRRVQTPGGALVQGFVISEEKLNDSLRGAPVPARFEPAQVVPSTGRPWWPVGRTRWSVSIDPTEALARARESADRIASRFKSTFAGGVAAAVLAGALVVALVAQADRLAQQRSRFAALAAHELRTPLAGLQMYGEMLAFGLGDPAKTGEYARRVSDEAARLGRVVTNVLAFSRLERGALGLRPTKGDVASAVREAVERQRPALEASGVKLEVQLPERMEATFDRDALGEIVQNLLDNAEKYTRGFDRTVRIDLSSSGLSVKDRGPGVPASARNRLFQAFERGVGQEGPAGLGLGLVLARSLARAMGGDLVYVDGPGAEFRLNFSA